MDDHGYNNPTITPVPADGGISSPAPVAWDGGRYDQQPFPQVEEGIIPGRPLERSPVGPLKRA